MKPRDDIRGEYFGGILTFDGIILAVLALQRDSPSSLFGTDVRNEYLLMLVVLVSAMSNAFALLSLHHDPNYRGGLVVKVRTPSTYFALFFTALALMVFLIFIIIALFNSF